MGIYITNEKKKTIKHFCTSRQVEKAIETLLNQIEDLVSSETHEGYVVRYVKVDKEGNEDAV